MPTLTAQQLIDFRQLCGDDCTPEAISDPRIQGFYDSAYALGEDEDITEALTCVKILRRLVGLASTKVDKSGEFQLESHSQLSDHTWELLHYYEGIAGIGGAGILSVGSLSLDINYDEDDQEAGL